jgi:hypothetical protein
MTLVRALLATWALLGACACARADDPPAPLVLERTIELPRVEGRIDHLAIDPAGQTLIVAELGNDAVDVVDLRSGAVTHRIPGLREPQGLAFDPAGQLIVVAERGDGAVRLFNARTYAPVASIPLGADADDVRVDPRNGHALVGYGDGTLAVVDLVRAAVIARIPLPAHPEGFELDAARGTVFVNLPGARTIGVVDPDRGALRATWRLPNYLWNYPMALDGARSTLAAVFRLPARLVVFDRASGAVTASIATCGDSDDVFVDTRRQRIYVACGAGAVDAFDLAPDGLRRAGRTPTAPGARTALFAPGPDRLFVAARASAGKDARILVFRPSP